MKPLATIILLWALSLGPILVNAQQQTTTPEPGSVSVRYEVTDLGTLGGPGTNSFGYDINNEGWVAGSGNLTADGPQHSFLWYGRGPLIDLGTLGGPNSEPGGLNLRGEAAILSETSKTDPNGEDFCGFGTHMQCLSAIWRNWKMTALPTLPGGHNSQAYGINDLGQVVGFSESDVADPGCAASTPFQVFRYEAAIWEPNGKIRKLRPLQGDTVGFAFGINNNGQAVGTSGMCPNTSLPPSPNGTHAVLWERDGSALDLGNLGGTSGNIATSINNLGEVGGNSLSSDGTLHPFLWTRTTGLQDLGTFPGAIVTVAPCCNTLNDRREMVGFSIDDQGNSLAFLWRDKVLADLNTLIPKDSPWNLLAALSVNDAGQIVGYGVLEGDNEVHAFLATPCNLNSEDSECRKDIRGSIVERGATTEGLRTVAGEDTRELLRLRLGRFAVHPTGRQ